MALGTLSEIDVRPEIVIALMAKDSPDCWRYMPEVCERLRRFCARYDSDADPEQLVQTYQANFVASTPYMICLVALDGESIIAHLLVQLSEWMGCRYGMILQYEHEEDARGIPPLALQRTASWVERWAKDQGAKYMQNMVRNPKLSSLFAKEYGYHPHAMIMRKALGE